METTTIRIDVSTHQRIRRIHSATGKPMIEIVRDALDALDRVAFAANVSGQLDALRNDPDAWSAYIADAEGLPAGDGVA